MKQTNKKNKRQSVAKLVIIPFTEYPRCAGILLHITSLPSGFGIGDMGPEAYRFANFLKRSHQTIWQLLPVNSSSDAQGFSPYGSNGSFAGNVLLISPELLVNEGLLSDNDLSQLKIKNNRQTDYQKAQKVKTALLDKAYINFKKQPSLWQKSFAAFCKKEDDWLRDFSLYVVLKKENESKSWSEWKDDYKYRNAKALQSFTKKNEHDIEKVKWQQWIFFKQWNELRKYCNGIGIALFGDLPFYVAYDSADVWSHQQLFNLDKNGNMLSEGGAPPDDFNAEGQRWGMPVYNWNAIKKQNYEWWLSRMKKAIGLCNLLRLDHFRGFSAFWDIKKNAESAKEGTWKKVNGNKLFSLLKKEIGQLPLVAEDLGSIDKLVLQMRDQFQIPGMIIQQVAFGEDMPQSRSIPHHHNKNSVVYTGNHDNNTTLGWFESLPIDFQKNISLYTNQAVTENNICEVMIRLVYASVAKLTVLPMQDILELGEDGRMNSVPNGGKSWSWRMPAKALTKNIEKKLRDLCLLYDRNVKEELSNYNYKSVLPKVFP